MSQNWQNKYRLTIKRPKGSRRSFDLILDVKGPDSRTQQSIKKIPKYSDQAKALQTLNEQLRLGNLSENDVEIDLKENVIPEIEKLINTGKKSIRDSEVYKANEKIFLDYWEQRYSHRKIIDKERTRNAFLYALDVLNELSLSTTNQDRLQKHWDKSLTGTAHRRYGRCINALMKFLKRDVAIQLDRNSNKELVYMTLDEAMQIASFHNDLILRDLILSLFGTGVRESEVFALTSRSLRGNTSVYVEAQIDRKLKRREIKNRNKHNALIIPECLDAIKRWCALDQSIKNKYRGVVYRRIVEASEKLFNRHLTPHNTRHGYSVYLIDKGVPLDRLSQFLGDTIEVVQRHYASFVASDYAIETYSKLLSSEKAG